MSADRPTRVAAIDIGTVTTRLVLAESRAGALRIAARRGAVTDLGEGVDMTGRFSSAAVERVLAAVRGFGAELRAFAPCLTLVTLTSAARDVENPAPLLDGLRAMGFDPQIIPGDVEASLTFWGVAGDFPDERIAVADSGGGSTEIVVGTGAPDCPSAPEHVVSLDVGCRRATDRFLLAGGDGEDAARAWARGQFSAAWADIARRPDRLVAVGGTVTTLVAVQHALVPYDSSFVHLHMLSLDEVDDLARRFSGMTVEQIAGLPGIEPKRVHVIQGGAIVVGELMRSGGYGSLTVSENGLLVGLARAAARIAERGGCEGGLASLLS